MTAAPLSGKTAIVTGAARSIGREIALELARQGAAVVVHYRSREQEAGETVKAVAELGGEAVAVPGDLSDSSAVTSLFERAFAEFGGVDIVVANAGATTPMTAVADVSDETYRQMTANNTLATFWVLRAAARTVRDGGRIINIGSSSGHFAAAGFAIYASTKAAAVVTTRVLASELGPRGITANTVIVGPVGTGFLAADAPGVVAAPPGALEQMATLIPTGRLGLPSDIAPVVAFLATPAAGWVNGQSFLVNNGAPI
ncbi:SDR family oxidoreductase [Dactylosporangium sp. CA-092794]|uniref:SDR family oxidoreductase n=1 Tax=Dactylosporangium sp. CA-092794 TaxID=3239929 RepID=UPI003D905697